MTLYEAFAGVTDPRRAQGRRIRLEQLLALVVIANLCGHHGYRPVARFCQTHQKMLTHQFELKHGVPSYVTFCTVLSQLPPQTLLQGFNAWAEALGSLAEGDWISGDGKALASTLTHMQDAKQNFQLMVSLWSHQTGLVHRLATYANAQGDERSSVRSLLSHFQDKGLLVRLDAIHTQKNDCVDRRNQQPLRRSSQSQSKKPAGPHPANSPGSALLECL